MELQQPWLVNCSLASSKEPEILPSQNVSVFQTTTNCSQTSFKSTECCSISFQMSRSLKSTLLTTQISCLAVHNNKLYAASINRINVYDLTNYELVDSFNCKDSASGLVKSIAFSGEKIFTAHQDCKIRVWHVTDAKRHRLISTLPTVADRFRRSFSSNNYVQVRRHKKKLWIEHADTVSGLAINPISNLIYSASWDKSFKLWRLPELCCLESVDNAHADAINAVVVSVDGTVYTASADGSIKVWEKAIGQRKHGLVTTLEKHKSTVNSLALNDDGTLLFSGGCDCAILVWEKEKEENGNNHMLVRWSLSGHTGVVLCLVYVDQGFLISGSADRTLRIWGCGVDSVGYSCLALLDGLEKPVKSLVAVPAGGGVSSDNSFTFYSGSLDGKIRVWQILVSNLTCTGSL